MLESLAAIPPAEETFTILLIGLRCRCSGQIHGCLLDLCRILQKVRLDEARLAFLHSIYWFVRHSFSFLVVKGYYSVIGLAFHQSVRLPSASCLLDSTRLLPAFNLYTSLHPFG